MPKEKFRNAYILAKNLETYLEDKSFQVDGFYKDGPANTSDS